MCSLIDLSRLTSSNLQLIQPCSIITLSFKLCSRKFAWIENTSFRAKIYSRLILHLLWGSIVATLITCLVEASLKILNHGCITNSRNRNWKFGNSKTRKMSKSITLKPVQSSQCFSFTTCLAISKSRWLSNVPMVSIKWASKKRGHPLRK